MTVRLLLLVAITALFPACAPRSMRVEFSCVSYQHEGKVLTDCADMETWKNWAAEQMKDAAGGDI